MTKEVNMLKVGDARPAIGPNNLKGVATIIKIVKLKYEDGEIDKIFSGLNGNQNAVWGKNLLDDPELQGKVDPDSMYIFEQ